MNARAFRVLLILSSLTLIAGAAGAADVTFRPTAGGVDVLVDGEPFTRYVYEVDPTHPVAAENVLLTKPVLYPLRTPAGVVVTRGWPFQEVEGEKRDHPHHIGLYFTYDEINGNDFWNNSKQPLPAIKHVPDRTDHRC